MALLEQWTSLAYNKQADRDELQKFWDEYFIDEKNIYEIILTDPSNVARGTVKELADRFKVSIMTMTGFLDGINESLVEKNPLDTMEESTAVSLLFDKEKLYKNMVEADADWLYNLPQWEHIFDAEKRKELYREQKDSHTVRKEKKVFPNDPCPCGSGKKYKHCCGRKTAKN